MDVTKVEFCCEKKGSRTMKKSKFSEEQIIGILRETGGETPVKGVCAKHNISEATFYKWRSKYGGMDVRKARRLRAMAEENSRLKRLVVVRRYRFKSSRR